MAGVALLDSGIMESLRIVGWISVFIFIMIFATAQELENKIFRIIFKTLGWIMAFFSVFCLLSGYGYI